MRRHSLGVLLGLTILAAAFVVAPVAGASTTGSTASTGSADASPDIEITQTNQSSAFCLPPFLALTHHVTSTPSEFILTITASAKPCSTVTAHAVIYQMPGNGVAWPQVLQQKQTFTISQRGTTVVTFKKHCLPVQFDVVTGATPEVISPWGDKHGALLFPFALDSALQYFPGPDCIPGGECDDYTPQQAVVNPDTINAGDQVTVSGDAVPGDTVTATLKSAPQHVLGSAVVDPSGQFSITGTVPASVPIGFYDITISSQDCPTFNIVTLTVGIGVQTQNVAVALPGSSDDGGPMSPRNVAALLAMAAGGFALVRLSGRRARIRSSS